MSLPNKCPVCGESDFTPQEPESYAKLCYLGTNRENGGKEFYHE